MSNATSITFQALYGVMDDGPVCYLLEVDEVRILLDCGWDERFDEALLEPLRRVAGRVDAVLLSHADLAHMGALPYAMAKLGLSAPVFGTLPIFKMGQMTMYDAFQTRRAVSEDADVPFNLDDVDAAFMRNDSFVQLKFMQSKKLDGTELIITPYAAGHSLGGALWKVSVDADEVLYAPDYNHKRELHLDGTVLESFTRPLLLITGTHNALAAPPTRKRRDRELLARVTDTVRGGGNVLLPIDASGRVLELLLLLNHHWGAVDGMQLYSLVLLTHVAVTALEFAKSQLEWMASSLSSQFDRTRVNPFELNNVKLVASLEQLDALPGPQVVLASSPTLEPGGLAHALLQRWGGDARNLLVLTQLQQCGSAAAPRPTLAARIAAGERQLRFESRRRVPLAAHEVDALREARAAQAVRAAENEAAVARAGAEADEVSAVLAAQEDESADEDG
eukprot:g3323.t1